jgi:hypothetical protein
MSDARSFIDLDALLSAASPLSMSIDSLFEIRPFSHATPTLNYRIIEILPELRTISFIIGPNIYVSKLGASSVSHGTSHASFFAL